MENSSSLQSEYPSFQDIMLDPATAYQKLTGIYDEEVDRRMWYTNSSSTQSLMKCIAHYKEHSLPDQKFKYVDTPLVEAIRLRVYSGGTSGADGHRKSRCSGWTQFPS